MLGNVINQYYLLIPNTIEVTKLQLMGLGNIDIDNHTTNTSVEAVKLALPAWRYYCPAYDLCRALWILTQKKLNILPRRRRNFENTV
jgi:hypothetical protein